MTDTLNNRLNNLVGKNNWKAFCIHLDRCIDREISFKNWADHVGLTFDWWKATDKLELTEDDYNITDVVVNFKNKSSGATACRLSHQRLYEYLLVNFPDINYFFIFEDDAGFLPEKGQTKEKLFDFLKDVETYNNRWDVIWFGYHDTGLKNLEVINDKFLHVNQSHRAHSFLINRAGLEYTLFYSYIEHLKSLPIDWIIDYIRKAAITIGPHYTLIDQIDPNSYTLDDIKGSEENCNFISRLGIMKICKQYPTINENGSFKNSININNNYNDSIYIQYSLLDSFLDQIADKFKNSFKLISGFAPTFYDDSTLNKIQSCNKIEIAFIENYKNEYLLKYPKLRPIPKGFDFSCLNNNNLNCLKKTPLEQEQFIIEIKKFYPQFNNYELKCFSPYINIDNDAYVNYENSYKLRIWNEMKKYIFVLCETEEQVYEVLCLNKIPVLINKNNIYILPDLPVIYITDYHELTQSFLLDKLNEYINNINHNKYEYEKLTMNYWKKLI